MTTHYLICKNCGHSIPGSSPAELTAEPRRCPTCDSAAWDIISGPLFPCRSRERETMYKKILYIVRWCAENDQPCRTHPGCCPLAEHNCMDGTSIPAAVFDWIMGVDLKYGRRVAERRKQRREEQHIAREYFETNHLRKKK